MPNPSDRPTPLKPHIFSVLILLLLFFNPSLALEHKLNNQDSKVPLIKNTDPTLLEASQNDSTDSQPSTSASSLRVNAKDSAHVLKHQLWVGIRIQKTWELYWENGITLQWQPAEIFGGRPLISADFVSSRLGSAINSNALKQEIYRLGLGLRFRNNQRFRPGFRLNPGFYHLDYEFEIFKDLDVNAFTLSGEILALIDIYKGSAIQTSIGMHVLNSNGENGKGGVFPLYAALEIMWGSKW